MFVFDPKSGTMTPTCLEYSTSDDTVYVYHEGRVLQTRPSRILLQELSGGKEKNWKLYLDALGLTVFGQTLGDVFFNYAASLFGYWDALINGSWTRTPEQEREFRLFVLSELAPEDLKRGDRKETTNAGNQQFPPSN